MSWEILEGHGDEREMCGRVVGAVCFLKLNEFDGGKRGGKVLVGLHE